MSHDQPGPPRVGDVATASTRCRYTATAGAPECGAPATVHVLVERLDRRPAALGTCDDHVAIARHAGRCLGEHPFEPGYCSHPDGVWAADGSTCGVPVCLP